MNCVEPGEPRSSLSSISRVIVAKFLKSHVVQDLQRGQGIHDAGFFVAHPGAMGAFRVHAERPRSRGAGAEYRVDVRDDEDLAFAGAMKDGDQIVGQSPAPRPVRCEPRRPTGSVARAARPRPWRRPPHRPFRNRY